MSKKRLKPKKIVKTQKEEEEEFIKLLKDPKACLKIMNKVDKFLGIKF